MVWLEAADAPRASGLSADLPEGWDRWLERRATDVGTQEPMWVGVAFPEGLAGVAAFVTAADDPDRLIASVRWAEQEPERDKERRGRQAPSSRPRAQPYLHADGRNPCRAATGCPYTERCSLAVSESYPWSGSKATTDSPPGFAPTP